MTTYIRTHTSGTVASSTGATVAAATVAAVPAGRTLVAVVTATADTTVTSLSKPGGEGASWVQVSADPAGSVAASVEVWAIQTTTTWPSATTITATWAATSPLRTLQVVEYAGLSTTVHTTQATRGDTAAGVSTTSGTLAADDLVVRAWAVGYTTAYYWWVVHGEAGATATWSESFEGGHAEVEGGFATAWSVAAEAGGVAADQWKAQTFLGGLLDIPAPQTAVVVALASADLPPYAPTLTTNAGGGNADRSRAIRLGWTFGSPNAIDSQSAYEVRYRPTGGSWTTASASTPTQSYDIAAGTLTAGAHEWQVRTTGALGKQGPWSASGYFTAIDPPDGPIITTPTDGATVTQTETVAWSIPTMEAYEVRRVADDTGTPDEGVVYWTTGTVTAPTTRSLQVAFDVNGRTEHVQVRARVDGIWTDWDSIAVDVSYTGPPAPTKALFRDPGQGALLVVITNPAPDVGQEATVSNNIWIHDGPGVGSGTWELRAVGIPPGGTWSYPTPVSGRDYTAWLRVEAVAANGVTTMSDGGN